jgi:hypothetical protein
MKIRPAGAELFHADRRTEMTKLRVTFRNFANGPKNVNSRIKLVATMVQVPSTVAQLFKCSTVWRQEDHPRYTKPSTLVSKSVRTASVPPWYSCM